MYNPGKDQSPKLHVNFRDVKRVPIGKTGTQLRHREEDGDIWVAVSAMGMEEKLSTATERTGSNPEEELRRWIESAAR